MQIPGRRYWTCEGRGGTGAGGPQPPGRESESGSVRAQERNALLPRKSGEWIRPFRRGRQCSSPE